MSHAVPSRGGTLFGPTALATPANALSIARILVTPVMVALIVQRDHVLTTFVLWVVMAGTDWIDGLVARRQGATRSGAFLDPLADKLLVLGALCALAVRGSVSWVPVGIIGARELGISAYRSWAGRRGVSLPASISAKIKTVSQDLAITLALIPAVARSGSVVSAFLWLAVAFTVATGVQYAVSLGRASERGVFPAAAEEREGEHEHEQ